MPVAEEEEEVASGWLAQRMEAEAAGTSQLSGVHGDKCHNVAMWRK